MRDAGDSYRIQAHLANRERLYRSSPFPLFGLPASYDGARALGESAVVEEDGREQVEYLGLVHGSLRDDDQPRIEVITALPGSEPDILFALAMEADVVTAPGGTRRQLVTALVQTSGPVRRIARDLLVDGDPVAAGGLDAGRCWILQAAVGDRGVTVVGSNCPSENVVLDRVEDPSTYLAGTRQALLGGSNEREN
jgi:hypothetical protein